MTDKRAELLTKMREAEEQREDLERMKRQILQDVEDQQQADRYSYQQVEESSYEWKEDEKLQRIFLEQQTILVKMRQERQNFTDDWEQKVNKKIQELKQQEDDYQREFSQTDFAETKEDDDGDNH